MSYVSDVSGADGADGADGPRQSVKGSVKTRLTANNREQCSHLYVFASDGDRFQGQDGDQSTTPQIALGSALARPVGSTYLDSSLARPWVVWSPFGTTVSQTDWKAYGLPMRLRATFHRMERFSGCQPRVPNLRSRGIGCSDPFLSRTRTAKR